MLQRSSGWFILMLAVVSIAIPLSILGITNNADLAAGFAIGEIIIAFVLLFSLSIVRQSSRKRGGQPDQGMIDFLNNTQFYLLFNTISGAWVIRNGGNAHEAPKNWSAQAHTTTLLGNTIPHNLKSIIHDLAKEWRTPYWSDSRLAERQAHVPNIKDAYVMMLTYQGNPPVRIGQLPVVENGAVVPWPKITNITEDIIRSHIDAPNMEFKWYGDMAYGVSTGLEVSVVLEYQRG